MDTFTADLRGGEIVNNVSKGILLHGLIHIRNEGNETYCIAAEKQLLANVYDSQVKVYPDNQEHKVVNNLDTENKSIRFQTYLNKTRQVISGELGLGDVGFCGLQIGLKDEKQMNKWDQQGKSTEVYHKAYSQVIIKRKLSLQLLDDGQLRFSKAVINDLFVIAEPAKRKDVYIKCRDFFRKYGSHVDLGKWCLGGVAEIMCECNKAKNKIQIKDGNENTHKCVINACIRGSYSFVGGKLSLTKETLKANEELHQMEEEIDSHDTKLNANNYGGDTGTSFKEWILSLDMDPTKLHIIDRGCLKLQYAQVNGIATEHRLSSKNHILSVWDLLKKQPGEVIPANTAKEAAHKLKVFYNTFLYRERIIEITNGIGELPSAEMFYDALMQIMLVNQWRKKEVKNLDEWGQFIKDDDTFKNFVEKMNSLPGLYPDLFKDITNVFEDLMEQVEYRHKNKERVKAVQSLFWTIEQRFPRPILVLRDNIAVTIAENIHTENGVAYSKALKTILENVRSLERITGNYEHWIPTLKTESISTFLLKPTEYMIMTMETFEEVCGIIKDLTPTAKLQAFLAKRQEIKDLVDLRNLNLIRKIQFRANVREAVVATKDRKTAEAYQSALEIIQDEVNSTLQTDNERSQALTELLNREKSFGAFLENAVNIKMSKKALSNISKLVIELLNHVNYIDYDNKRNIIRAIQDQKKKPAGACAFFK